MPIDISKYLLSPDSKCTRWWYVDPTKEKELKAFLALAGIKKASNRIWHIDGKSVVLRSRIEKELNALS